MHTLSTLRPKRRFIGSTPSFARIRPSRRGPPTASLLNREFAAGQSLSRYSLLSQTDGRCSSPRAELGVDVVEVLPDGSGSDPQGLRDLEQRQIGRAHV